MNYENLLNYLSTNGFSFERSTDKIICADKDIDRTSFNEEVVEGFSVVISKSKISCEYEVNYPNYYYQEDEQYYKSCQSEDENEIIDFLNHYMNGNIEEWITYKMMHGPDDEDEE